MNETLLNHPLITSRYFFPRRASFANPFYVDCGDVRLACFYQRAHPGARTLVHFHGNGEVVADYVDDFVALIDRMGYNCFLVEYRGYGMSNGTPALAAMLDDVEPVLQALGEPPEKLVLFGRSIGSLYAIHGAYRVPRVAGLIIESGIANPLERIIIRVEPEELNVTYAQLQDAMNEHFNHQEKLKHYTGPTLIMHTRYDGLVDASHAQQLHEWAAGPKQLKLFDQGDHNSIMFANAREYFRLVHAFMEGVQ